MVSFYGLATMSCPKRLEPKLFDQDFIVMSTAMSVKQLKKNLRSSDNEKRRIEKYSGDLMRKYHGRLALVGRNWEKLSKKLIPVLIVWR